MNGMVPPSPISIAGLPKWRCDARRARSRATAQARARPSRVPPSPVEADLGAVRRVALERALDRAAALSRVDAGGIADRQLEARDGASTLPALAIGGSPRRR